MTLSLFSWFAVYFGDGDGSDGCRDEGFLFQDGFLTHTSTRTVCQSSPAAGPAHVFAWIIL